MVLSFTVLGVAAPQGSLVPMQSKTTGRMFVKQSCKRTMPWRQEVAHVAQRAVIERERDSMWPACGPVELRVTFVLPRPAGHSGTRGLRPSAPLHPSKKPDLSKLVRAIEDAMTGIVYDDDARIVRHRVQKEYVRPGEAPRAVIEVETLSDRIGDVVAK